MLARHLESQSYDRPRIPALASRIAPALPESSHRHSASASASGIAPTLVHVVLKHPLLMY